MAAENTGISGTVSSLSGDPKNYRWVFLVILLSFLLWSGLVVAVNLALLQGHLKYWFGPEKPLFLEVFCWGALGGTMASYRYFANDKDANEVEALKIKPDPAELRYPDAMDVGLYGLRILFSGVQGVVAVLIAYAGLVYFDVPDAGRPAKQKVLFCLFAFIVGLNQTAFLTFLGNLTSRFLNSAEKTKGARSPKRNIESGQKPSGNGEVQPPTEK